MLITAKHLRTAIPSFGEVSLKFECSAKARESLEQLKYDDYVISISKPSKSRSLQQNKYLWELLGQISMKENGNKSADVEIYMQLIEQSGAKVEYLMGLPEVEKRLKRVFRVVTVVDSRDYNGKQMNVYKCYYGSSKMSVEEMGKLIDATISRAEADGIDTEPWREYLYE